MTTQEQCEAILRKMLELANQGKAVTLSEDWSNNSATIEIGGAHTHVGNVDEGSWDEFVGQLYSSLHGGPDCRGRKRETREMGIDPK